MDELITEGFGDEAEFLLVNGQAVSQLSYINQVSMYPTFVHNEPGEFGEHGDAFNQRRTKETVKDWILSYLWMWKVDLSVANRKNSNLLFL